MASPTIPSLKLPFTSFPGLDMESSRRIWRDFEAVASAITPGSAGIFDAVIDASLTASNPATHQYKNLTELVAAESWTTVFNVGVIQRRTAIGAGTGSQITEPGTISLAGKGDLVLFGIKPSGVNLGIAMGWNWRALTGLVSQQSVIYYGITFEPSIATGIQAGGEARFHGCSFSTQVTGFNTLGSSPGAQPSYLWDCELLGVTTTLSAGVGDNLIVYMDACRMNTCSITVSDNGQLYMYGGGNYTNGSSFTISGSGIAVIQANGSLALNCNSGTSGGACFANVTGRGNSNATISTTDANVCLTGDWRTVSFSGVAIAERVFKGTCASIIFKGPGFLECVATALGGLGGAATVELQGDGVSADLEISAGRLQATALTNSTVRCEFNGTITAGTFYSFDNSTHNNTFIFGGTHNVGFVPGSVVLGTGVLNRIITEDLDTLMTGTGGAMGNNMLNAEIAAVNSGVTVYGGNTAVNDLYGPAFLLGGM